ncbi:PIG-L family deacetylase [Candidatus Pelagibacter sp.]|nr:PIG-L family deacetylase [Candidatus Pelagibacter sp.]
MKKENILVVVAHPDDETLGCGGTIQKYVKLGHEVYIIVFADGESSREKYDSVKIKKRFNQLKQVCKLFSCRIYKSHNYPDNQLDKISNLEIAQHIENAIKAIKPKIIFTHHNNDLNIDHRKISNATLTACRPTPQNTIKELYYFETISSSEWNFNTDVKTFSPNKFVNIEKFINKKIKAIKFYKKELKAYPHPRSLEGIKNLARYRGQSVGMKFAEAFMIGFIRD